jgi:hypothetical protein
MVVLGWFASPGGGQLCHSSTGLAGWLAYENGPSEKAPGPSTNKLL